MRTIIQAALSGTQLAATVGRLATLISSVQMPRAVAKRLEIGMPIKPHMGSHSQITRQW
jgi:hypothetical protein